MENFSKLAIELYPGDAGFTGFGPLGNPNPNNDPNASGIDIFAKFISSTIGLLTIIAIIWFVFVLITGAISWIGAGGDKGAVESARKRITNGVIGLFVTVVAIFLIDFIGKLIGIPDILNIGMLFNQILQ